MRCITLTSSTEGPAFILAEAMKDLAGTEPDILINWDKNKSEEAPKPNSMRRGALTTTTLLLFHFFIRDRVAAVVVEEEQPATT